MSKKDRDKLDKEMECLRKALEEILYLGDGEIIMVAKRIAGKALVNNTSYFKTKLSPDIEKYTKRFISAHQRKED